MNNFDLKVNDQIEVIVNDKSYKSLIIDVDSDWIKINLPVNNEDYLMLSAGDIIEVNTYLNNGKCYNFNAKIICDGSEVNSDYYKLSEPYNVKRIERRDFFRVGVLEPVYYKNISGINEKNHVNLPYISALMLDLSGGGIKIKVKEDVKLDDSFLVKIIINKQDLVLRGQVVCVENVADRENLCGVKFIDITEAQSDKIICEVFKIIRKQRAVN